METSGLVIKAKNSDKEALIRLVMDRKDEYYKLAYTYMGNRHDSMDALQDMIVILFRNIKKLKNDELFYSWSKTILVNCCKQSLKKKTKVIPMSQSLNEEPVADTDCDAKIDLRTCMKELSSKQQEALRLKYFLDLDYKTISDITKTPEGTVKSRVFNAIGKLRNLIGGEYV